MKKIILFALLFVSTISPAFSMINDSAVKTKKPTAVTALGVPNGEHSWHADDTCPGVNTIGIVALKSYTNNSSDWKEKMLALGNKYNECSEKFASDPEKAGMALINLETVAFLIASKFLEQEDLENGLGFLKIVGHVRGRFEELNPSEELQALNNAVLSSMVEYLDEFKKSHSKLFQQ